METPDCASSRLHVLVEGRVHGVGFRYSTARQALALSLTGWVRNLSDGRVEALFEGPKAALQTMLAWCEHGPPYARVTQVTATWQPGTALHSGFQIRG